MPVLPLIDLMLFGGWTALLVGFILKAIALLTKYRPTVLGLSASDFFLVAIAALLFVIALAARTWVKSQDSSVTSLMRKRETLDAWEALSSQGVEVAEQEVAANAE